MAPARRKPCFGCSPAIRQESSARGQRLSVPPAPGHLLFSERSTRPCAIRRETPGGSPRRRSRHPVCPRLFLSRRGSEAFHGKVSGAGVRRRSLAALRGCRRRAGLRWDSRGSAPGRAQPARQAPLFRSHPDTCSTESGSRCGSGGVIFCEDAAEVRISCRWSEGCPSATRGSGWRASAPAATSTRPAALPPARYGRGGRERRPGRSGSAAGQTAGWLSAWRRRWSGGAGWWSRGWRSS